MGVPFTLDGIGFTDADFAGYAYQEGLPRAFAAFQADAARAQGWFQAIQTAAATGPVQTVNGQTGAVALADATQNIGNPDFTVSQRAASPLTVTAGTIAIPLDRWRVQTGAGMPDVTVTWGASQEQALGETIKGFLQTAFPAGGAGSCLINTRIEDARTVGGRRSILNVLVFSPAPTTLDRVIVQRVYGSGGSATETAAQRNAIPLIAGWNRVQLPIPAADVSGKTIVDPGSYLNVLIYPRIGTTTAGTFRFGRVWMDDSTSAQDPTNGKFPDMPPAIKQILCERYYERLPVEVSFVATAAGQVFRQSFPLVRKAKNPALTRPVAGTLTNGTLALEAGPDPTGGFTVAVTAAAAGLVSLTGAVVAADAEL